MVKIIVSFGSEREAQEAISRLSEAGVGEVRARMLDSSESMRNTDNPSSQSMMTPELGSIEVRPTDDVQQMPDKTGRDDAEDQASGVIPITGRGGKSVQLMLEVDEKDEARVRQILGVER